MRRFAVLWTLLVAVSAHAQPTESQRAIALVAAPTPNVFPLLLAMARHPELPVRLVPVKSTGTELDDEFDIGQADGMFGMTYTIAHKVAKGQLPDLKLRRVALWRGFFQMTPKASGVRSYTDLKGQGLIVSGPLTGGRGGGPDFIFQAALRRAGVKPHDFALCYLPVKDGLDLLGRQAPLNSHPGCDRSASQAARSMLLVEPASTGLAMKGWIPFVSTSLHKGIDIQTLFTGYAGWPTSQLPHGGWAVRQALLDDPVRRTQWQTVERALDDATQELADARHLGVLGRLRLASLLAGELERHYGQWGLSLPTLVLARALGEGELVYRADLPVDKIQSELQRFLGEVLAGAPAAWKSMLR